MPSKSKIYEQTTGRRAYNGCQIPRTWDIYTTYVRLYISFKTFTMVHHYIYDIELNNLIINKYTFILFSFV